MEACGNEAELACPGKKRRELMDCLMKNIDSATQGCQKALDSFDAVARPSGGSSRN